MLFLSFCITFVSFLMVLVVNETGKAKNDNMKREESLKLLADEGRVWDMVIIGGGATGLGCAVDAVLRGYSVALFEQDDFAKGTSSRSTKLVHGGVRYLQHGDVALVFEALRERGRMKANAPHLVKDQAFVISNYRWNSVASALVKNRLLPHSACKAGRMRALEARCSRHRVSAL